MLVLKFGGTSVKDANAISKVINIIKSKRRNKLLVVSSALAGITNQLIDLADNSLIRSLEQSNQIINQISKRHIEVINNLLTTPKQKTIAIVEIKKIINLLSQHIEAIKLLNECTERSKAFIMSFGELLSTTIIHFALLEQNIKSKFLDIRKILITNDIFLEAVIDNEKSSKNSKQILKLLKDNEVVITQGFIASDYEGKTTTLGRGGSDYSAAILASYLNAKEIQIWTDVNGILTTDPKIVPDAKTIKEMSFEEIRELSFYGAKVLHPDTIKPAIEKNIPVKILNTFNPKNQGTLLTNKIKTTKPLIHSIITKNNCIDVKIPIPPNENQQTFISDLFKIFSDTTIKVMFTVSTKNYLRIIFEDFKNNQNLKKLLTIQYDALINKTGMICISGVNLDKISKCNHYTEIIQQLKKFNINELIHGISNFSLLALYKANIERKLLKSLHKLIFE